ncbi:ABC transporter permease [Variovorax saccharolyticus]|uniref:ABC transporter permease n=1 Tax=Variovorax saccharolyticus TaxID=3053516 RepID=UPI002575BB77|nr:iron ABC transporter permease [Variovorax sp. J22R187]MDM0021902.1 iron ABC transporter permease [Variovorax sp. J22R187]
MNAAGATLTPPVVALPGSSLNRPALRRALVIGSLALLLGFLTLYPLLMLLYGSFHTAPPGESGSFSLAGYRSMLTGENLHILLNTALIALTKTVLSLAIAVALAFIIARTDVPLREPLEILITLPFFIPPILTAMAWGMLGNTQVGTLNIAWRWLTGSEAALINVYSWGGVVWHMMQYSIPFLFLLMVEAIRAIDPSLEESARTSGTGPWTTARRITLPLLLPIISSLFVLSFIRGIESFESPMFFGTPAGIEVITTQIYHLLNRQAAPDYQSVTAMSFGIVILMMLIVVWQRRLLGGRSYQTITGKGFRPRLVRLGVWRWPAFAFCMLFFVLTVALPVGQLLLGSLVRFVGFYEGDMFTLSHYVAVWRNDVFWRALGNTALLGIGAATAVMLLGSAVAYIGVRTTWRGRHVLEMLAWLPWFMPGMVLGVGFLWAFSLLPNWIPIYGTVWALFLAYVALGSPLATRVMSASFMQISNDLEECSRAHGAGWTRTFWRVLVALAWPSFAAGWVLTFFMVLRELSASILLYSAGSEVLSVVMLRLWMDGKAEEVSVIGLLMLLLVLLFRFIELKLIKRRISTL